MRRKFSRLVQGDAGHAPVPYVTLAVMHNLLHRYGFQAETVEHTRGGLCYWLSDATRDKLHEMSMERGDAPFDSEPQTVQQYVAQTRELIGLRFCWAYTLVAWAMRKRVIKPEAGAEPGYLCVYDGMHVKRRQMARYLHAVLDLYLTGATDKEIEEWEP